QIQLGTERGTIDHMKVGRPPSLRLGIAFGEHADRHGIPGLHDRLKLPRLRPHESVRRRAGIVRFVSKPGEADGYASPNGAAALTRSGSKPNFLLWRRDHWKARSDRGWARSRLADRSA